MPANSSQIQPVSVRSFLGLWALSFGCIIGWGAFVMPGTTFLPQAGPLGTLQALLVGGFFVCVIAGNMHAMLNRTFPQTKAPAQATAPGAGGMYAYVKALFGYDHAFLCAWALCLAYISLIWANASAFILIARSLFSSVLQRGFHYVVAGYDVYLGEILVTLLILFFFGLLCERSCRWVKRLQLILALLLLFGVILCFFLVCRKADLLPALFAQPYARPSADGGAVQPFLQVFSIVVITPWAFVGFETVALHGHGSRFPRKCSFYIMLTAIGAGILVYGLLTLLSVLALPSDVTLWQDYLSHLSDYSGLAALPAFHAAETLLGRKGLYLLSACVLCALSTSMLGFYRAAAFLMQAISADGVLPAWFSHRNRKGLPDHAIRFIMIISIVIPFLGRTAIGWLTDVTTASACIAYLYISLCTLHCAVSENRALLSMSGAVGAVISIVLFFFPMVQVLWHVDALASESYLILAVWSIGGFMLFRYVFQQDRKNRYGRSPVMWVCMLFIIFFSTTMWARQIMYQQTEDAIENISGFHVSQHRLAHLPVEQKQLQNEKRYMESQMNHIRASQLANSLVQFTLIGATLVVMFNIFSTQKKRERDLEAERLRAEASSRAKTAFLSNMSHDIRTPMNAIISFTSLARKEGASPLDIQNYLARIDASSKHLLALINDVLEMSRIESGSVSLNVAPCDLHALTADIGSMFASQMEEKKITFTLDDSRVRTHLVLCDKTYLYRLVLNLVSNACKFTPEGGTVSLILQEKEDEQYVLTVSDNGIGMSPEFADKVFAAFERERTSTVSGIQGTGLGMAISKSIVDLMGGSISVQTAKGRGTTFTVRLHLKHGDQTPSPALAPASSAAGPDFSAARVLLVDDVDVNREIGILLLKSLNICVETAENGKEAVDKVLSREAGYYNALLMDIQMPVMDGYEAARAIRSLADKKKAGLPIIAMTANAFSEDVQKAKEAGMNAHVAKPIDLKILTKTLSEYLREQ